jgi:hypothetical protein
MVRLLPAPNALGGLYQPPVKPIVAFLAAAEDQYGIAPWVERVRDAKLRAARLHAQLAQRVA